MLAAFVHMDPFFLLLSLTLVPVLLVYVAYCVCCLFIAFAQPWKRVLPLLPVVLFGLYLFSGTIAASITVPAILLLATVESLVAVMIILFRSYGRPMRFLSFSAGVLSLLITLFVFGAAEDDFRRHGGDSPLGLVRVIKNAPAKASAPSQP